jgi:hypothetical protein
LKEKQNIKIKVRARARNRLVKNLTGRAINGSRWNKK